MGWLDLGSQKQFSNQLLLLGLLRLKAMAEPEWRGLEAKERALVRRL
jgi:hypothetical protein